MSPLLIACGSDNTEENETTNRTVAKYTETPPLGVNKDLPVLVLPEGSVPYEEISYWGYDFKAVVNDEGDTTNLVTHDTTFITPEGYKIGTAWKDIPLAEQTEVSKVDGFGYYLKLYSGWKLGFCAGDECTNEQLSDESRVAWIEK